MRHAIAFALAASVLSASASAATITENTLVNATTNPFTIARTAQSGAGPIDMSVAGDIVTWTADSPTAIFNAGGREDLADNGTWTSGRQGFVGTHGATTAMSFTFAAPVAAVGGIVNYAMRNGAPTGYLPMLSVYGVGGTLLETFNLLALAPISTPSGNNQGAFRGFSRATNDIARFELRGSSIVLDDLTWARLAAPVPPPLPEVPVENPVSAVPLPPALPLLAAALGALGLIRRRA